MVVYVVTAELMERFKQPFGLLLQGTFSETMRQLKEIVDREKPSRVIAVGDTVSRNLHVHGINAQLSITDSRSLRRRIPPVVLETRKVVLHVRNPRGTITDRAMSMVREALLSEDHTHIVVDGEEDLLTLAAVLFAPDKAFVVYGQPHEGVVVVKATAEKKAEAKKLLESMKRKKS
jgi:uncharacterized protein (UPF0218 family)